MGRLETPPPTALSASDGKTSLAFSTLTHCLRVNPRAAGSATHRLPPGRVALTRGVRRAAGGCGHSCSPALLALREPSRWMMMSAPFIIRRLWPDRMLPSRSGLGSVSTSGWGATAGAPLLQADQARPAVSPLQPWCPPRAGRDPERRNKNHPPAAPTNGQQGEGVDACEALGPSYTDRRSAGAMLPGWADGLSARKEGWLLAQPRPALRPILVPAPRAPGLGLAAALPHPRARERPQEASGCHVVERPPAVGSTVLAGLGPTCTPSHPTPQDTPGEPHGDGSGYRLVGAQG